MKQFYLLFQWTGRLFIYIIVGSCIELCWIIDSYQSIIALPITL